MWIKICGITRPEDALSAGRFGADAVGFVFAESPRRVTPEKAKSIIDRMPPRPLKVGVFVDVPGEEASRVAAYCGLDLIQLHGDEDQAYCDGLGDRVIKAIRVGSLKDLGRAGHYRCRAVLLDGYRASGNGDNGNGTDWRLVRLFRSTPPIVIAGGLDPENVRRAVADTMPYGVDVSRGVESEPGVKDPVLLYRFIENARRADYEVMNG